MIEGREQLFLMDTAGSGERQLTRDAADHEDPVWSPDGKGIAFVLIKDRKKALALIDPESGATEVLGPAGQSPIHPSFSPDGTSLLYCTDDDLRPHAKNESKDSRHRSCHAAGPDAHRWRGQHLPPSCRRTAARSRGARSSVT